VGAVERSALHSDWFGTGSLELVSAWSDGFLVSVMPKKAYAVLLANVGAGLNLAVNAGLAVAFEVGNSGGDGTFQTHLSEAVDGDGEFGGGDGWIVESN